MINYRLNERVMIIHLITGLIKKIFEIEYIKKMSQYFPKPYEPFGGDINVKVDLSNYGKRLQQILIHQNLLKRFI